MDIYLSSKKQIIVDVGPSHFILLFLEAAVKATAITHYSYISLLSDMFYFYPTIWYLWPKTHPTPLLYINVLCKFYIKISFSLTTNNDASLKKPL